MQEKQQKQIVPALKVHQWFKGWDSIKWNATEHRRRPEDCFYVFSLSAKQLRALSGVYRRSTQTRTGLQRSHESKRSENIGKYVKYGYPWSDLTNSQRKERRFDHLQKPGWLPTAIVVNILSKEDSRNGRKVAQEDLVKVIQDVKGRTQIELPQSFTNSETWKVKQERPIEIIDGQHRLLAFDDEEISGDYELPVVAFFGLDISWQAYLFWTINIKPKRINPSLAYDLYPLLRTEEWLEQFEGHKVYREIRAQELVEMLWSEEASIWRQKINMLGESGGPSITQAAWIRALIKTYIKSFEGGKKNKIGGLFGAPVGTDKITIAWNRAQQGALLIYLWNQIGEAVAISKEKWVKELRDKKKQDYKKPIDGDAALFGPYSLLTNDQGVSVVLNISNDLLFLEKENLGLPEWGSDAEGGVVEALDDLAKKQKKLSAYLSKLAKLIVTFDWRTSGAIGLTENERTQKLSYRGGSGYKEFRRQLLKHLMKDAYFSKSANEIYHTLGYAKEDKKKNK